MVYGRTGHWHRSADAFEHAWALDATDPSYCLGHASALIATQDAGRAADVRDVLLSRFPDRADGHVIAGHLFKIHGFFGEAADAYRCALHADPRQTEAIFNLVDLSPPEPTDPFTETLEALCRDHSLSNPQLANVRFALARIYEKAGLVGRAFPMLQEANASADAMMRELGHVYDPEKHEADTRQLIEMFPADAFGQQLEPLDLDLKIIFIVGLPRSGTTLVERILSSHSRVSPGGELPLMQDCLAALRTGRQTAGRQGRLRVGDESEQRLLLQLREQYLDGLFERDLDGEYVTDKLPANFAALGLIRLLFPDSLIVHCSRDPLATCWSLYAAHFGTHVPYCTSFERLAHYYNRVYSPLMAHWHRALMPGMISVKYEELVLNPEEHVRELLRSCGLPWESSCLSFHKNEQPIYTASMQQARQPFYSESLARWRKFEKYLRPLIKALENTAR